MKFSVLGPVRVEGDGGVLEIRGMLRRTMLAVLLLHADTVVSSDRLAEHLWGAEAPSSAGAPLYNQVMRLRQALGEAGDRVRAAPPGYLIHVGPGELDLREFAERRESGSRAHAAGRWAEAEQEYAEALGLWRGEPFADLPALADHPAVRGLTEDRLQVTSGLIEARLNLGRHREVVDDLVTLVERHPLHQSFHSQLMLALYRAGRRSEALDAYGALRQVLVDEMGIEPSAEIQDLHERIRDGDETLLHGASPATKTTAPGPRRQLPADTRLFTGRTGELNALFDLGMSVSAGAGASTAVISALNGMAGVGKSALAIHVAHRISESFPDGQLFVDLHGHTAGMKPLRPLDALHQLLRSLDVAPQLIPEDLAECAALYRSTLVGTKTLIVLDDAAGTGQVGPLLPGEPGCFVLVTSRSILTGLDSAQSISIDVLPEEDSVALLRKVAGSDRVPADHPALSDLVELCGRIPLAIRIAGARLRHHLSLTVEDLVARMRGDRDRLEHLRDDDRSLTALFDASYDDLPEAEQRLFRFLGLVPGPDVDAYVAANLIDSELGTAGLLLESLLERSLLTEHGPGRYRLHDLLRVYARGRAAAVSADDANAALTRLLDYYRHTALAADRWYTTRIRSHLTESVVGHAPESAPGFPDEERASAWLATELPNLLAAIALEGIAPAYQIALTTALATFLYRHGPWPLAVGLHETAASVAREAGDRLSEGHALVELSQVQTVSGQVQTAIDTCERALVVFRSIDDLHGIATALDFTADFRTFTGEFEHAMEQGEQALALYRELGDKTGMATTLWNLGRIRQRIVDPSAGAELLKEALGLFIEIGSTRGEALISGELARGAYYEGRFAAAAELSASAVRVFHESGHRQNECMATLDLSRSRLALGDFAKARELQERSLALSREAGFRFGEATAIDIRGDIHAALGDHLAGADAKQLALQMFQELGDQYGEAMSCHGLGRSKHAVGDFAEAVELFGKALDIFREVEDVESEASTLVHLGALAADTSGSDAALTRYRQALEIIGGRKHPLVVAEALEGIARCLAPTDPDAALIELRKAVALYREMGVWQAARAAAFLAKLEASASATQKY
jgi:DNA-binding SARP family transcriptional activator